MDQQEEFERFEPKGDFPPKEPHEPFSPGERPTRKGGSPLVEGLQIPLAPLTKEKLTAFLVELKLIVKKNQELSRDDQHVVGNYIHEVRTMIGGNIFSDEIEEQFDDLVGHYNKLLTRSTPSDQQDVLAVIEKIEAMLL